MQNRPMLVVAALVAALSFMVGDRTGAQGAPGETRVGAVNGSPAQEEPTVSPQSPSAPRISEVPPGVTDPETGEKLVVIDRDWRSLEPFASRFRARKNGWGARHAIRLAAHHFATDDLVAGSGRDRRFSDPDMSSFPSHLVGKPFRDGPMDYWLIMTGPKEQPGIDGGLVPRQGKINGEAVIAYVCTVDVPDIDATVSAVEHNGGTIAVPKMSVPTVGWLVYFKDTEGNIFGAMQNDPEAK